MPYLRQTSALVGAVFPSRRIWMIYSSLNRRFIPRSFTSERSRLTIHLVQFVGSRSTLLRAPLPQASHPASALGED